MDYVEDIVDKNIDITESVIKNLHYIILKTINNENAERYRNVNVLIYFDLLSVKVLNRNLPD
ncbi:hypothetical protein [Clostridium ragsdalei]|uniref:hypothetical protein n=1 Tax=Clostridium ragsdalei TaxID=217158 RepID=UPI0007EE93FB|nr:hypothetical protein [Clostridium ragsdalei]